VSVMLYSFIGHHISLASDSYACFNTKIVSIKIINVAFTRGMHKTYMGLTDVSCPYKVKKITENRMNSTARVKTKVDLCLVEVHT